MVRSMQGRAPPPAIRLRAPPVGGVRRTPTPASARLGQPVGPPATSSPDHADERDRPAPGSPARRSVFAAERRSEVYRAGVSEPGGTRLHSVDRQRSVTSHDHQSVTADGPEPSGAARRRMSGGDLGRPGRVGRMTEFTVRAHGPRSSRGSGSVRNGATPLPVTPAGSRGPQRVNPRRGCVSAAPESSCSVDRQRLATSSAPRVATPAPTAPGSSPPGCSRRVTTASSKPRRRLKDRGKALGTEAGTRREGPSRSVVVREDVEDRLDTGRHRDRGAGQRGQVGRLVECAKPRGHPAQHDGGEKKPGAAPPPPRGTDHGWWRRRRRRAPLTGGSAPRRASTSRSRVASTGQLGCPARPQLPG